MEFHAVLDPCCGSRMMWFNKKDERCIYGDKRQEKTVLCDGRTLEVNPDILMDFTQMPFDDNTFYLVVFDPPHLEKAGDKSWLVKKYGKLGQRWQEDLKQGFTECFRVLKPNGTLIFKWNETQIKVKDILSLTPYKPLFGHVTKRHGGTHWFTFMKN